MTFSSTREGLRLRTILNAIPQMVWSTRPDGHLDFFNDRWYEFTGVPVGSTDGEGWNAIVHPDDQARAWERWRRSLATGGTYEIEYRLRHHTGAYRWTLGRALPVRDAAGAIERWFGTCTDIDDLKQAQSRSSTLAAIVEHARDFVGIVDMDGRVEYLNPAGRRLMGIAPESDLRATPIRAFFTAESRDALERLVLPAVQETGYWEGDLSFRPVSDEQPIPALFNLFPVRDGADRLLGYATVSRDLRERKRFEEARELIARELSHRIKNIFAVVSSLVMLSARGEPAARPFAQAVRARIEALAQAHEYVRPHSPASRPAEARQTVEGLLSRLLAAYQEAGGERIAIGGPDVPVGVTSATALALVVHELATNAIKYGALSVAGGTIALDAELAGDRYTLTWRERGGPAVTGPPQRFGFGTMMAERVASAQLGAEICHDWAESGLVVTMTMAVDRLAR
ncbi:MAG: sensor histidine kinase [Alphaproteobacteria bacterium]